MDRVEKERYAAFANALMNTREGHSHTRLRKFCLDAGAAIRDLLVLCDNVNPRQGRCPYDLTCIHVNNARRVAVRAADMALNNLQEDNRTRLRDVVIITDKDPKKSV